MTAFIDVGDLGTGYSLPWGILLAAVICSLTATLLSLWSMWLQLKNYRKIHLQRWVVRILMMVPIYAIASCVSLFSSGASFFIDAVRDVYEAFVIYCFFGLLVEYLGGERSLIILLHGRPAMQHTFPVNHILSPLDVSDPFAFLGVKRGILQYVQIKPVLAVLTMVLKALGAYTEGALQANNGYTYVSVCYNISVAVSLYCLVLFWSCTHDDLKPYRPLPKFICVKGLIFATFWQNFLISILVSAGAVKYPGYDKEDLSVAISDALICYEMPLFALLHLYAFSHRDYIDDNLYAGRMPFYYALRDSLFGYKDVFQDSLTTFKGTGFTYRTFEPAEGAMHRGIAREKRVRAGLRYVNGGQAKYWLPMPGAESGEAYGRRRREEGKEGWTNFLKHPVEETQKALQEARMQSAGYAPISPEQAGDVVHRDPREVEESEQERHGRWEDTSKIYRSFGASDSDYDSDSSLDFGAPASDDEGLFDDARKLEFGDFNNPVVDASKEEAKRRMREEEDVLLHGRRPKGSKGKETRSEKAEPKIKSPLIPRPEEGNSIASTSSDPSDKNKAPPLPEGCIDLIVEDREAEVEAEQTIRNKGDVLKLGGKQRKIYRRKYNPDQSPLSPSSTPYSDRSPTSEAEPHEEEVFEVAVEREGIGASADVTAMDDIQLVKELDEAPDYIKASGFASEEHGGSRSKNPWMY